MARGKVRKRVSIPTDESKSERFVRVVTPRVKKALKSIKTIGFCASNNYEFTSSQVGQISDALAAAHKAMVDCFEKRDVVAEEFEFQGSL